MNTEETNMKRDGHEKATFFIGPEVEHTPAFGKKTLFVVGKQDLSRIESIAKQHKTPHIFMGANHSFNGPDGSDYWKTTITALLDKGFWVTIDYPAHIHNQVLPMFTPGVWQCRTFVPMLRVCIANVQTSSPNLVIKVDDVDFKATNPGVWVWHHHEITDSNRFTDWQDYGTDVVISQVEEVNPEDLPAGVKMRVDPVSGRRVFSTDVGNMPKESVEVALAKVIAEKAVSRTTAAATLSDTMGLDPEAPSALKAEPFYEAENGVLIDTEAQAPVAESKLDPVVSVTADAVADMYADGAKEDTLMKPASKKVKTKKTV